MRPYDLRLPDKFEGWREGQEQIIRDITRSKERFVMLTAPTGSGKSLAYIASSLLIGGRTCILTSTKGLQDQLEDEFGDIVKVVKGKQNYRCRIAPTVAAFAPCNLKYECEFKEGGCAYYDAVATAKRARVVVTNYSYWLSNPVSMLGQFQMLVCDEAHHSVDAVFDHFGIQIGRKEAEKLLPWPKPTDNIKVLLTYSLGLMVALEDQVKNLSQSGKLWTPKGMRTMAMLQRVRKVKTIQNLKEWVGEQTEWGIQFDLVWPDKVAEDVLFREIPKVVLTSATVNKKVAEYLGVKEVRQEEYMSPFPSDSHPFYHIPTVRLDHKITNEGLSQWVSRVDQIVQRNKYSKGIIHTVSYERCKRLLTVSDHRDIFISHDRDNLIPMVEVFKEADPPIVLISPSVVTGYDFPYDECRWQILGKVPFPDSRSMVMQKRQEMDPEYAYQISAQSIEQAAGRGMRAPDDRCVTYIIDDHFTWFFKKYQHLFSKNFVSTVRMARTIPQ